MAKKNRPATNPASRENQLIAMAMNAAEALILDGTASSQILVHFLRLGTERAKLESIKLEQENQLLSAKTQSIKSSERSDEFYQIVLHRIELYSGKGQYEDES